MKLIIFGTTWVTAVIVTYIWMGIWSGDNYGGTWAGVWFWTAWIPTVIVGGTPFVIHDLAEDAK